MCDKAVCERWCVTKKGVTDCATKLGVKDGVCERWCATKLCVKAGV